MDRRSDPGKWLLVFMACSLNENYFHMFIVIVLIHTSKFFGTKLEWISVFEKKAE